MSTNVNSIELDFRRNVSEELEIVPHGDDRFDIVTPVAFGDGDVLPITLRKAARGWELTDEGHTFFQLTYELEENDFGQNTRREIINNVVTGFGLENRKGELVLPIENSKYGDALYTFIQALVKLDDIRYLSRDRVRSTFMDDFRELTENVISPKRAKSYNWHEPNKDPKGLYPVDCKVNGTGDPLFIFALPNDQRVAVATIALHTFRSWNIPHKSIGIFEDQSKLDPKMVARFTDIVTRPYSSLAVAEENLPSSFPELVDA